MLIIRYNIERERPHHTRKLPKGTKAPPIEINYEKLVMDLSKAFINIIMADVKEFAKNQLEKIIIFHVFFRRSF